MTHPPARPHLAPGLQAAGSADPQPGPSAGLDELLERYGVAVIIGATYEWGGYRYSSADHAIAAARRDEAKGARQ
ncbi:MAG TPA: hypothetical protein VM346_04195 [Sphingomicrobium sp.]|nr:hypothetical protein [Sphingomicrobium sp.]